MMMAFAGASQFMAVQMATAGALDVEIIFAILVLNFRHIVMTLSLMDRLKNVPFWLRDAEPCLLPRKKRRVERME